MEAQPILPVKATGVLKQESAKSGMSDVFQTILREHETRDLYGRRETARSSAARNRLEPDAGRPPAEPRRPDAPRETREDDRYAEPRDDRPAGRDIDEMERRGRSGGSDEPRPDHERPDRGVDVAAPEAGVEETDNAAPPSGGPDEDTRSGRPGDGAPDPLESDASAFALNPGTATGAAEVAPRLAEAAGGVAGQTGAAARTESADPKNPLTGAPGATLTPAAAGTDPRAALGGAPEALGLSQAEASKPGTQIAINATHGNPTAVPATAGAVVEAALGKRPGAPGQQAGAASALSEPVPGPATSDKGNPASAAFNAQLAHANQRRDNPTTLERADNPGHRTGVPAAKDPAVPIGQSDANQAARNTSGAMAPSAQGAGQRTPTAHDPALKAGTASGVAAQTQAGLTGIDPIHGAARASGAPSASIPVADRPVTPGDVVVNIQRAAARGDDRIRIRLHPAELGQVDVRLKVGADGIVRAMVQVDRPETLDFMQRDARGLERALQDAGLKTDSGSLSFNLRDNGQGGLHERHGDTPTVDREDSHSNMPPALEEAEIPSHTSWTSRALDIRV